jgi:hypothetical protein
MVKVLAAEMSDPSRLRRGKQYAQDGSVLDIVIDPGTVTCEIQGSRSMPYIATVTVTPGDGMPLRRDAHYSCTCPDDDNWDGYACKHVVAALFALSNEFLLEPELLDLWRGRTADGHGGVLDDDADDDGPGDDGDDDSGGHRAVEDREHRRRGHLRLVGSDERSQRRSARTDPLVDLLRRPDNTELPDIGDIERIEPMLPRSRELSNVLRDALGNLRIEWE